MKIYDQRDTSANCERIEDEGEVFYSLFSEYDHEVIHLAPDQMQALQHWFNDPNHAAALDQDVKHS
jgi:hypothetical protein